MEFTTTTSTYRLEKEGKDFILTKLSVAPGQFSVVIPGQSFRSPYVAMMGNSLCVGNMHTSPITNHQEVREFISE